MIARILVSLIALGLAACSAPMDQAPEPVADPMVEATALETLDPCEPTGDGIGGTGCPEL